MNDIAKRIAELSPEKRKLLLERLNRPAALPIENGKAAPENITRPRRDSHALPLSFAQQRLWFLDQLEPGSAAYNIPLAFRIDGALDGAALQHAFDEIIQRHEILRTTFDTANEQPVQIIAPVTAAPFTTVDLGELSATARTSELQRLTAEEAQRPFDLRNGPLLRITLLRLHEKEHVLLLTLHHIIADGWSLDILMKELAQLYNAFAAGKPSPLPALPMQYGDFAQQQREWLQEKALAEPMAYWKQQLAGAPPLLEMPTDRPRPPIQTFRGACEFFELSRELSNALVALSRRENVTLFMTLLAAFKALLSRYTGQDDIVVGSPIAGRNHTETENLIGLFVNNLVLRTNLDGNPTFQEILRRLRQVTLDAFANQDVPFEKLVEELQPARNLSYSPLFQVMFISLPPVQPLQLADLTLTPLPPAMATARFELNLNVWENPAGLRLGLEYNTDLFEADTIRRLLEHYRTLLAGVVADPSQRLSALPLLISAERSQMLVDWNATRKEYPVEQCFHQLFEAQVERTPEAVAVTFENQQLTYRELNRRANQLARYLKKLGVGPETMVGVCLERSPEMLIGLLGILKAGGAYVPLDPAYPAERIAYVLADAQVPVLLTQRSTALTLASIISNFKALDLDTEWPGIASESAANLNTPVEAENLAYTIYTSGSTGKPKGVNISQRALVNFLVAMREVPGFIAQDTLLAVTTLSFDIAGLELYLPLLTGGRVVVASREVAVDGNRLLQALSEFLPTVMQATPATWRMLIENGWAGARGLKILCGGEAMPRELASQLLERSAELWNMYGPTETTIWSTLDRVENRDGALTIGRPIANTQVYLLDRHLHPVPRGVHGALHIGGDGLARGYFKRPDLTAEKFIPNAYAETPGARIYHTGDLARYLADGKIDCLGRVDHQVKIRGFRIELGEIEAVCAQHPQVEQAVVMIRDAPSTALGVDKRLVAYLVSRAEQQATTKEIRQLLASQLPSYMMPTAFVFLESLPLTPNGKVDRRALPAPELNGRVLPDTFVAPQAPMEKILAGIWRQVLGVERIGIDDNFFELGGHSLLATQINSRLRKILGLDFPLRTLFEAPTVAAFSQILTARFGNNGKLEKIAQLLEKMHRLSGEEKKRLLEQERHKKILE